MKAIPGYERYIVTRTGKILNRDGTLMRPAPNDSGYHRVWLYNEHGRARKRVHVLVCEAYHGPRPSPEHEVLHKDNNRTNNHADNLRWGTKRENLDDMKAAGSLRGERNPNAKLSDDQTRSIRILRAQGSKLKDIAATFQISILQAWRICSGRRKTA